MPTIEDLLHEHGKYIVREQLRKIVEIYDDDWIIIHELVQNSIDAVQSNDKITRGQIDVNINIDKDQVTIKDNGTGFKYDLNLLCPGGTGLEKRLSSRSPTKGYQGVGLKAVMYSTKFFELESQTSSEKWTFKVEDLSRYISQDDDFTPHYYDEKFSKETFETYTKIKSVFIDNKITNFINGLNRYLNPDAVKWKQLYNEEKEKLEKDPFEDYLNHFFNWYFRTQSYVGCVNMLIGVKVRNPNTDKLEDPKPIDINLTLESESKFEHIEGEVGNWLRGTDKNKVEIKILYKNWDYSEIAIKNSQKAAKYKISPDIVDKKPSDDDWEEFEATFRDKFLDIKLIPNDNKQEFREKYKDFISLIERPRSSERAENYQDVLEKITGIYLAIGRTSHFETLGLENRGQRLIAANGTPTAHELIIRSTSSTWYLETIHMIINVDETLNLGKRHLVNSRFVGRLNNFFEACYPKLVKISKLFVERSYEPPGSDTLPSVLENKKINRKDFPFSRFPSDENSLIGMFSVVIRKIDPDFTIYGFFSAARYDGKYLWNKKEISSESELSVLEFKLTLNVLINEFELAIHDKDFDQLSLIIVWDRRCNIKGWSVKGVSASRKIEMENKGIPTDLIDHLLEDRYGNYRPLISVADLINNSFDILDQEHDDINEFVDEMK